METKQLLYGLFGFLLGGIMVLLITRAPGVNNDVDREVTMNEMTASLTGLKGDDYDKAFISHMINHHQAAVDMAKLSADSAKHDEIKQLSKDIINAQEPEIAQMRQWQKDWGYESDAEPHSAH